MNRGEIWLVNLEPTVGSEQEGQARPCVIIQNDIGNQVSPVTVIAAITGAEHVKKTYPHHVFVKAGEGGLTKDSVIMLNQIRTVDKKRRLIELKGTLSSSTMSKVDQALKINLDLQ